MWRKILNVLKNKYFIVSVVFLVWLVFFDQNNIISQLKLSRKLKQLQQQKEYYEMEIRSNEKATLELMNDTDKLQKYAREKYLMKKDNEDIYIFEEKMTDTMPDMQRDTLK
ncbi:MAG TPA: septum formation initiator family protein [Bacteroidales bacterium]|nr:septum formation initiator family protein [Bacteroidales bacterium]HNS47667.1 septum formation initiator family protein [Bacteroidales bacterium]